MAGVLVALLSGCERIQTVARKVARPTLAAPEYLRAPQPLLAALDPGGVRVGGDAPAGAKVELRSPDGDKAEATADAAGRWSVVLPAHTRPQLYAFDATVEGRTIRAEGALCLMPGPTVSVLVLRAGAGAAVLGSASVLTLAVIDFDGGGGVAASGLAPANTPVRLSIDGAAVGLGRADAQGRYVLMGLDPRRAPAFGSHRIGIDAPPDMKASQEIFLTAAAPLGPNEIYRAIPAPGGWRIDWRLPGGGLQTSVVLSPPVTASTGVVTS